MANNRVCEALNIQYPVIQGPMAWTSKPSLVAEVSEAGGLGTLGCGFAPPEVIREQIRAVKSLTDKPFAANVFMAPPLLAVNSPVLEEEKPAVVYADTLGGLNLELATKYFGIWHDCGMKVVFKASFISDAVIAEQAGADVVLVKGWEGGGHTTDETTMVLVPQAADCIFVIVCALLFVHLVLLRNTLFNFVPTAFLGLALTIGFYGRPFPYAGQGLAGNMTPVQITIYLFVYILFGLLFSIMINYITGWIAKGMLPEQGETVQEEK